VTRLKDLIAMAGDPDRQGLGALLVGGTLGMTLLQVTLAGLGLIVTVVLASLIGASGYGAYAWALAWVTVLRIPATLGRDRLLVRNLAAYYARGEWGLLRGLLRRSTRVVVAASLVCLTAGTVVVWLVNSRADSPLLSALQVGLLLVPLVALISSYQGALQGFHRVVAAQTPDAVLRPVVFLALIGVAYLLIGDELSSRSALLAQGVAMATALAVGIYLLRRTLRTRTASAPPRYESREWNRSALAMASTSGLGTVLQRFDVIAVGIILGAADAGVYGVATRAGTVVSLGLGAMNVAFAPIISRLHALDDPERLRRGVTLSTRLIFIVTLVAGTVMIAVATPLLNLIGNQFSEGADALRLLCVAWIVNAAAASNTLLLMMTRYERATAVITAVAVGVNIVLNLILIPLWGITGAAVAMLGAQIARNALMSTLTWRRLGIDSTILGLVPRHRAPDPPPAPPIGGATNDPQG
jgi:O-antigen/teichoic acid export membrane protein